MSLKISKNEIPSALICYFDFKSLSKFKILNLQPDVHRLQKKKNIHHCQSKIVFAKIYPWLYYVLTMFSFSDFFFH